MYRGKFSSPKPKMGKPVTLLVSVLALVLCLAGGSLALLIDVTDPLPNYFKDSFVACEVAETFENNVKSNVSIRNTGDIDAFIRADVIITWQNDRGEVHSSTPIPDTDYEMTMSVGTRWFKAADGFWYYSDRVAPQGETDTLIRSCKPTGELAGYHLVVEIIAEAIQADGLNGQSVPPVELAWPQVTVVDGSLQQKGA